MLVGVAFLGAGAFTLGYSLKNNVKLWIQPKDRIVFSFACFIGAFCAPLLMSDGASRIAAGSSAMLGNIVFLTTIGLAWIVFNERSKKHELFATALAALGGILVSLSSMEGSLIGFIEVALANVLWGLDLNLQKRIHTAPSACASFRGCIGGGSMVVASLFAGALPCDPGIMASIFIGGSILYGAGFLMTLLSLPVLGAVKSGTFLSFSPIIGFCASLAFESFDLTPLKIAGLSFSAVSLCLLLFYEENEKRTFK